MQIIQRTLSDLEYVKSLTGQTRDIVVEAYVRSFENTYCKDSISAIS